MRYDITTLTSSKFSVSLANQAQWKQTPAMLVISLVGYTVNYFAFQRFPQTVQVSNALS